MNPHEHCARFREHSLSGQGQWNLCVLSRLQM